MIKLTIQIGKNFKVVLSVPMGALLMILPLLH